MRGSGRGDFRQSLVRQTADRPKNPLPPVIPLFPVKLTIRPTSTPPMDLGAFSYRRSSICIHTRYRGLTNLWRSVYMRFLTRNAAVVVCCFIFALVFVAPATMHSDEWNLTTRFTINHAFEVPGLVLQPNTRYVIRLYDSPAERHV